MKQFVRLSLVVILGSVILGYSFAGMTLARFTPFAAAGDAFGTLAGIVVFVTCFAVGTHGRSMASALKLAACALAIGGIISGFEIALPALCKATADAEVIVFSAVQKGILTPVLMSPFGILASILGHLMADR